MQLKRIRSLLNWEQCLQTQPQLFRNPLIPSFILFCLALFQFIVSSFLVVLSQPGLKYSCFFLPPNQAVYPKLSDMQDYKSMALKSDLLNPRQNKLSWFSVNIWTLFETVAVVTEGIMGSAILWNSCFCILTVCSHGFEGLQYLEECLEHMGAQLDVYAWRLL